MRLLVKLFDVSFIEKNYQGNDVNRILVISQTAQCLHVCDE
jgi:hypothetical protein